jgi:hypothetical protein
MAPTLGGFVGPRVGASLPLHWFKKLPYVFCRGPEEAHYLRVRRFALSSPRIRHPRNMTRGLEPPCHRLAVVSCGSNEEARYRVRRFPHPKSGTHAA